MEMRCRQIFSLTSYSPRMKRLNWTMKSCWITLSLSLLLVGYFNTSTQGWKWLFFLERTYQNVQQSHHFCWTKETFGRTWHYLTLFHLTTTHVFHPHTENWNRHYPSLSFGDISAIVVHVNVILTSGSSCFMWFVIFTTQNHIPEKEHRRTFNFRFKGGDP